MTSAPPTAGPTPNLAALAHELRTPLAAIAGLADALRTQALGPLPDDYVEYGRLIRETALHAISVIGAVAETTPAADDSLTSLSRAAHDVIEVLRPRAISQSVSLALQDRLGAPMELSARASFQILFNLLDNALKATRHGGALTVSLDEDEGLARIEVADTGGAGPPEAGGGIGYSVIRALCAAHGGELRLETSPLGAVARVWLAPAKP